jgi:PAS domain-containing protein
MGWHFSPQHGGMRMPRHRAGEDEELTVTDLSAERTARRLAGLPRGSLAAEIEALYRHSPVGLVLFDRALTYVRLNQVVAEMNGLALEDHIGRTVYDVLPRLAHGTLEPLLRVFETGQPCLGIELRGQTPRAPGIEGLWRASAYPITGAVRVGTCRGRRAHGDNARDARSGA